MDREIYDLIPGLVIVMDTDHTILDLNETAARTAGKRREDCVGAKFWDLYDNAPCRAGTCAASEAVRTGKVCEAESKPLIQGKEVAVLVTAAPRFDQGGRVVGVIELVFPAVSAFAASFAAQNSVDGIMRYWHVLDDVRYRELAEERKITSLLDALMSEHGFVVQGSAELSPSAA